MTRSFWDTKAPGVLLVVAVCLLWEVSSRSGLVNSVAWPPFSSVAVTFFDLVGSGELPGQLLPSLKRLALGYIAATLAAVALGLLMG
jgi:ABC-type nitrate/sulfonate/bicarbonate transport system permease component